MNPNDIRATNPSIINCPIAADLFGGLKLVIHNFVVDVDGRIFSSMSVSSDLSKYSLLLEAYEFLRTSDFLKFVVSLCCGKSFRTEDEARITLDSYNDVDSGDKSYSRINIQIGFDWGEDIFNELDLDDIEVAVDVQDVHNSVSKTRSLSGYCGKIPYTNVCVTRCAITEFSHLAPETPITSVFQMYCLYEERFLAAVSRMMYPLIPNAGKVIRNEGHLPFVSMFRVAVNLNIVAITAFYTPAYMIDQKDAYFSAILGNYRNFGIAIAMSAKDDFSIDSKSISNPYLDSNNMLPVLSNLSAQFSTYSTQLLAYGFYEHGTYHRNGFPYEMRVPVGAYFSEDRLYYFSDRIALEPASEMGQFEPSGDRAKYPVYQCNCKKFKDRDGNYRYSVWTPTADAIFQLSESHNIIVKKIVMIGNLHGENLLTSNADDIIHRVVDASGLEFDPHCHLIWASLSGTELRFALWDEYKQSIPNSATEPMQTPDRATGKKPGFISAIREVFRKGKNIAK